MTTIQAEARQTMTTIRVEDRRTMMTTQDEGHLVTTMMMTTTIRLGMAHRGMVRPAVAHRTMTTTMMIHPAVGHRVTMTTTVPTARKPARSWTA